MVSHGPLIRPNDFQSSPFRWIPVSSETLRNILDMKLQHFPPSFLGMSWKILQQAKCRDPHGNLWDPKIKPTFLDEHDN